MKLTVNRKKEIKLEKLLYQEYLRKAYIVYNCQHHHVSIKREKHEKDLIDQIKELKEEVQEMRQERDKDIGELTEWMKKINGNMGKLIDQMEKIIVENLIEQSEKNMATLRKERNDRKRNNSERNEKRSCYHCGKEGHVRPFCPELRRN